MKDGKVESLKEAIALILAHDRCNGQDCRCCPMNVDRNGHPSSGECEGNMDRVDEYWEKRFGVKYFYKSVHKDDPAREAYDLIIGLGSGKPKEDEPKKEERKEEAKTCETCLHSDMHPSGILFCKSFHNFVHENGFCYRHDDGKMDEETTCG